MPRRTLLFIAILTAVTIGLITLALATDQKQKIQITPRAPTVTQKVVEKTTNVYFAPESVQLSSNQNIATVDIMANTSGNPITGVQVEISYDPKLITNVRIAMPPDAESLFRGRSNSFLLFNEVKPQEGRANYAIAIQPTGKSVTGVGKVAKLTFSGARPFSVTETLLALTENTVVTEENETESVLKGTVPLTILFSSP